MPEQLEERLAAADAALDGAMAQLVERCVTLPGRWRDSRSRRLDAVLLHPVLGLPLFFLAMALMFQVIYAVGVPAQEGLAALLDQFGQLVLKPLLAPLPTLVQGFLLEGLYQGLGTVMAFLPVIALFFWPWAWSKTAATSRERPISWTPSWSGSASMAAASCSR